MIDERRVSWKEINISDLTLNQCSKSKKKTRDGKSYDGGDDREREMISVVEDGNQDQENHVMFTRNEQQGVSCSWIECLPLVVFVIDFSVFQPKEMMPVSPSDIK